MSHNVFISNIKLGTAAQQKQAKKIETEYKKLEKRRRQLIDESEKIEENIKARNYNSFVGKYLRFPLHKPRSNRRTTWVYMFVHKIEEYSNCFEATWFYIKAHGWREDENEFHMLQKASFDFKNFPKPLTRSNVIDKTKYTQALNEAIEKMNFY